MAETEGFEPSIPVTRYGSLAGSWFQPLTHVSAPQVGRAASRRARYNHAAAQRQDPNAAPHWLGRQCSYGSSLLHCESRFRTPLPLQDRESPTPCQLMPPFVRSSSVWQRAR